MDALEQRQQDVAAAGAVGVVPLPQRAVRQHVDVPGQPRRR